MPKKWALHLEYNLFLIQESKFYQVLHTFIHTAFIQKKNDNSITMINYINKKNFFLFIWKKITRHLSYDIHSSSYLNEIQEKTSSKIFLGNVRMPWIIPSLKKKYQTSQTIQEKLFFPCGSTKVTNSIDYSTKKKNTIYTLSFDFSSSSIFQQLLTSIC